MKRNIGFMAGLLFVAALVLGICLAPGTLLASGIQVEVDGQYVVFSDQAPYVNAANRTMVPLRAPMEALGAAVSWDEGRQTATITKGSTWISFSVGEQSYIVNGTRQSMDTCAEIRNSRVLIPIKYAANALGCQTTWVESTQTVVITSGSSSAPEEQPSNPVETDRSYATMIKLGDAVSDYHFHVSCEQTGETPAKCVAYAKTNMSRLEMDIEGIGSTVTLDDYTTMTRMYYIPSAKKALQSAITTADVDKIRILFDPCSRLKSIRADYTGTTTLDGKTAYTYLTHESAGSETKIWLWADNGMPLKYDCKYSDGSHIIITWTQYEIGNIADSLFQLPSGVQIIQE